MRQDDRNGIGSEDLPDGADETVESGSIKDSVLQNLARRMEANCEAAERTRRDAEALAVSFPIFSRPS